ncbi:IS110 family transposase [Glutamicibacter sp. BW78]|uniref:IS110 family transposase n=1 Tax=Glutamicibacter sp. BW78 TaxID=2024403 RepID=UPI000BB80532|nr:IS110 family transposase [Glutamicibacter sp. BW78]PCC25516.1 IS110 family transposase [Glutamicibacter sp. BW78]
MSTVAEEFTHVVGVDTHAKTHTYAILASTTGHVTVTGTFPTSPAGISRALAWASRRTSGESLLFSVEGASSYGAGLTRALTAARLPVCDVRPPRRRSRVGRGKSDDIDAIAGARAVLGADTSALIRPRAEGQRNALRILLNARRALDGQRNADRHALTALARTCDLDLDARKALTDQQIDTIGSWRSRHAEPLAISIARTEAKRLARAVKYASRELESNRASLTDVVEKMAPGLLEVPGVGPVTAAIMLCVYSHHGRVRSEAAFAALAGVNPIPASSGNIVRHRLNRSGDRQLNQAIDTIARSRMGFDPATKDYIKRRTEEGKTKREIRRCLKRFIARQLFRKINALMA